MPRILLLGAGGQLGMVLARELAHLSPAGLELTALTRTELDFSDSDALRAAVQKAKPEIVVNAAAYTAVDRAETEQTLAHQVNTIAPGVIAQELKRVSGGKGWLIHYSTDYVFDGSGTTPWVETDATGPLSVYGQTKLDGELAIAATGCRHLILRTSWVYAEEGRNFLHTMLRLGRERDLLKIVDDQIGAPTTAEAITEATIAVLKKLKAGPDQVSQAEKPELSGVYHLTCGGATSWCGFAQAIFAACASRQKAPQVVGIPTEAYPTPATRPHNSRLCGDKFRAAFGFEMPTWEAALADVVGRIAAR